MQMKHMTHHVTQRYAAHVTIMPPYSVCHTRFPQSVELHPTKCNFDKKGWGSQEGHNMGHNTGSIKGAFSESEWEGHVYDARK